MESEEKLCVKVLRTLQQMLLKKSKYGERVSVGTLPGRGGTQPVGRRSPKPPLVPRATSCGGCCCKTTSRTGSPALGASPLTPRALVSAVAPLCSAPHGWLLLPTTVSHVSFSPRSGPGLVSHCGHPVPAGQGGGHQVGV